VARDRKSASVFASPRFVSAVFGNARPRRSNGVYESIRVKLHAIESDATYVLTDFDAPGEKETNGRELLDHGLLISIGAERGSAIITYKKKP
jgi:hypothetical protein